MKLTGWTVQQIDETPAALLDWLLKIESTSNSVAKEAANG